jgi:Uma2 family endonuclease
MVSSGAATNGRGQTMISIDLTVRRFGSGDEEPDGEESGDAAPAESAELLVRLPRRPLTLADVGRLADADESHRYELADGNLLVRSPDDVGHTAIVIRVGTWLADHGYSGVLAQAGVLIVEPSSGEGPSTGRTADLVVLRSGAATDTPWIDPAEVDLVVEVVAPGSEALDRVVKPVEYARAGIPQFWRVERDGPATAHLYRLGVSADGEPAYLGHRAVLMAALLAHQPPALG